MPATLSTITGTFPPAAAHSRRSASGPVSPAAPPLLGVLISGALLEVCSWRSVFARQRRAGRDRADRHLASSCPESADKQRPAARHGRRSARRWSAWSSLVYSIIEAPTAGWLSAPARLIGIGLGLARPGGLHPLGAPADHTRCSTRAIFIHREPERRQPVDLHPVLRLLRLHLPGSAVPADRSRRLRLIAAVSMLPMAAQR